MQKKKKFMKLLHFYEQRKYVDKNGCATKIRIINHK